MAGLSLKDTDRFLPLRLGPTARSTLEEFVDIDVTASDLVAILQRNQAYKNLFARFVHAKIKPKAEEGTPPGEAPPPSPVHRMVSLLGMIGSRNLILSLRMHKAVAKTFPINDEGEVDVKASQYLARATEAEEAFLRGQLDYGESAYAAGVLFDWLARLVESRSQNWKALEPYVNEQWKKALRAGLVAYHLSRALPGFSPKQAIPAAMAPFAGKILLAEASAGQGAKSYADWDAKLAERELPPLVALVRERHDWGLAHEEVAAHALHYFDLFAPLAPVVRHCREPYLLKYDSSLYPLTALTYLSTTMALIWKVPTDNDPMFARLKHPSLAQLRLKPAILIEAMKNAMKGR